MSAAFTRTASGLTNYNRFHGVDCMVYTEGVNVGGDSEVEVDGNIIPRPDVEYYSAILKAAAPTKRFKVKCVGNKAAALTYAKNIELANAKNSFVIVDKDLEGVVCSTLMNGYVITTKGYSWENELWGSGTTVAVLSVLTNENKMACNWVRDSVAAMGRRLRYIGALDAAAQTSGFAILKKTSALCGVQFTFGQTANPLSAAQCKKFGEIYRLSAANACPVSSAVFANARKLPVSEIVQGHFWSNATMRLMAHIYKVVVKDVAPSNTLLLNIGLSALRQNPPGTVGQAVINYYQQNLQRLGIQ